MKTSSIRRFVRSVVATSLVAAGTATVSLGAPTVNAAAGDLLFSQYMEGSGTNKAVEISNISGAPVSLDGYSLELYSNGSATVSTNSDLTGLGTIAVGDVFVLSNSSANPDIQAVTDANASAVNWNGDDAIVLRGPGAEVIDSIGQVGSDPGSEWGDATVGTQNESLCRSSDVTIGDLDPTDLFDPATEWEAKGIDNIDGLGIAGCDVAQDGDLLFSQYMEGSSSNKAIEILNDTGVAISLDGYSLELYSNGSPTATTTSDLTGLGTIADGDVFVLSNSGANAAIQAVTDANVSAVNWNGDDAIVLQGPLGVADSIGQVGFDPGSAWNGTGVSTQNDTMCRLGSVTAGDTDPSDVFDPSVEWEGKGIDNIDGLGEPGCTPPPEAGSLIFTQYIEGSSNNKAIEIANLGTSPVDLSVYDVERYSNGGTSPTAIDLAGTLAPGEVFVLANTSANADILAVADLTSGSANWNGDDALVLRDGDGNVSDSFGQVGFDPGSTWGSGDTATANNTLCRLDTVITGDTDPSDVFDPAAEWFGKGNNNIDGLGSLSCDLEPVGDLIFTQYVEGSSFNKAIEIANLTGAPIELGGYAIEVYFNGNTAPASTITPTAGILADGEVFVIANPSASQAILDVTDQTSGSVTWNGDDAIVLRNTVSTAVADSFGQVGVDPGSAWTVGGISTVNDTLCRNGDIGSTNADTDPTDAFDPSVQWSGLGQDNILGLGAVGCIDTTAGICGDDGGVTLIHAIQGSGAASPLVGQTVIIEGVVMANFQAPGQIGGFVVQEEDTDADPDDNTSEGIAVFDFTPVTVGDTVRVRGVVEEFFDSTQIGNVSDVVGCAGVTGIATPFLLSLPHPVGFDFESIEHMAVDVPGPLVVTDTFNLGRFGELVLSVNEPLLNPTQAAEPGPAANAVGAENDRSRITLDDARSGSELVDVAYFDADGTLRRGDTFSGTLHGVMSYNFGAYKVQPLFDPTADDLFTRVDERDLTPPEVGGDITVASFNVLNYFLTLDERGADTVEELTRQRDKIISAVTAIDADIVGLIELENGGAAIADLVDGFNDAVGAGTYDFINTGPIGTDAITVGYVYKPASVMPVGNFAILDSSVDPAFIDTKNRPALIQTFEEVASGGRVTVAINHFKSKGSPCDDVGDPDLGDEQGNCNGTRTAAATALANYLGTDPTGAGTDNYLILGDINAYPNEDPIDAFEAAGYVDLLSEFAPEAQSFVFFGEGGRLDHALASPALMSRVTGADEWSINAAESRALDYNVNGADGDNPPGLYQPDPFRSSDHDPVIVGLSLGPPPPAEVLLVVGNIRSNGNPPSGDAPMFAILEGLGANVTLADDDGITAAAAHGKDLVVIASSVMQHKVGTTFTDVAVPVASWEGYLFDELGFNTKGNGRNGETGTSQTVLEIVNDQHPISAGYSGVQSVGTMPTRFAYSRPEGDAAVIAEVGNDAVLFTFESGAVMAGGLTAPARRVGLFPSYFTPAKLTSTGTDLITAAFAWALGRTGEPSNSAPVVDAGENQTAPSIVPITIVLDGTVDDDGRPVPPGDVAVRWSSDDQGVTFGDNTSVDTTATLPGPGTYVLTLTADDSLLQTSDTMTVTVVGDIPQGITIAYVANNTRPPSGDVPIIDHLRAGGATVIVIDDDDAAATSYGQVDLIFVSTSVELSKIGDLFKDTPIPLITTEQYLLDDNMMALSPFGQRTTVALDVVAPGEDLAAGFVSSVRISNTLTAVGFGSPAATASVIATVQGKSVYFAYEVGTPMIAGFVAPADRIFFPGSFGTATVANANYFALLDAAVVSAVS